MTCLATSLSEEIESKLKALIESEMQPLQKMMEYALFSGGKRIRPLLTLMTAELFDEGAMQKALTPACAVEMIHTYSLIHDDLPCMDDDDFRRGKETVHRKFGEGNAVLAGDTLLTYAFEVLASAPLQTAEQRCAHIHTLGRASGSVGMIGGQALDITFGESPITMERLQEVHNKKTGALIAAACIMGGISAGASEKHLELLEKFGCRIGLAFQVVDDLLDKDEEDNASFVALIGEEKTRSVADRLLEEAHEALSLLPGNTEALKSFAERLVHRTI